MNYSLGIFICLVVIAAALVGLLGMAITAFVLYARLVKRQIRYYDHNTIKIIESDK